MRLARGCCGIHWSLTLMSTSSLDFSVAMGTSSTFMTSDGSPYLVNTSAFIVGPSYWLFSLALQLLENVLPMVFFEVVCLGDCREVWVACRVTSCVVLIRFGG